jgi:site-specific DNA-methyltransferase (adenine-specific)
MDFTMAVEALGRLSAIDARRAALKDAADARGRLFAWERLRAAPVTLHERWAGRYGAALQAWERWAALDASLSAFLVHPEAHPFEVLHAAVEEVLLLLPDASVDFVDADPPYGTGEWVRPEVGAGADCRAVHHKADWDVWDPSWIPEALRVSRGPVATMTPMTPMTPMTRLEELLRMGREAGVSMRLHPWIKPDPRPRFSGQPAYGFEPAVIFRSNVLDGGEMDYTIASAPREGRDHDAEGHPHQKPVDLLRRLVRQCSPAGGTVLSLFAGSGTTAEAALLEGRRVLAVEGREEWAEKTRARCARASERLHRSPSLPLVPVQLGLSEVA